MQCFRTDFSALDSQQESSSLGEAKSRSSSSQQLPLALCLWVGSWAIPSHFIWDSGLYNKNILNRFNLSVCVCVCTPTRTHMCTYVANIIKKGRLSTWGTWHGRNLREGNWEDLKRGKGGGGDIIPFLLKTFCKRKGIKMGEIVF